MSTYDCDEHKCCVEKLTGRAGIHVSYGGVSTRDLQKWRRLNTSFTCVVSRDTKQGHAHQGDSRCDCKRPNKAKKEANQSGETDHNLEQC